MWEVSTAKPERSVFAETKPVDTEFEKLKLMFAYICIHLQEQRRQKLLLSC